ncbi:MAG: OmpA family protein [Alphaproteobacteria bacterium]
MRGLIVATLALAAVAGCTQVRDAGDGVMQATQRVGDGVWTGAKSLGDGVVKAGRNVGDLTVGTVQRVGKLGQKDETGLRPPLPPDPCQQFGPTSDECAQDKASVQLVSRQAAIYFVAGEIKIGADQRAQIAEIAARVRADAETAVRLEAFAERGEARNQAEAHALATQRARVVREAFMADGVPGERIYVDVRGWNIATFEDAPSARRVSINLVSRR